MDAPDHDKALFIKGVLERMHGKYITRTQKEGAAMISEFLKAKKLDHAFGIAREVEYTFESSPPRDSV